jgi:hypothetical protein
MEQFIIFSASSSFFAVLLFASFAAHGDIAKKKNIADKSIL